MSVAKACRLLAAAIMLAALPSCGSTMKITVHSSVRTNDGATMYMMVRSWDGKPLVGERYQEVAAKVFQEPPDQTVLATKPIVPAGEEATTTVTVNEDTAKEVVVYFFFTEPGPGWTVPLRRPLPSEVDIDLGRHDVDRVRTKPR